MCYIKSSDKNWWWYPLPLELQFQKWFELEYRILLRYLQLRLTANLLKILTFRMQSNHPVYHKKFSDLLKINQKVNFLTKNDYPTYLTKSFGPYTYAKYVLLEYSICVVIMVPFINLVYNWINVNHRLEVTFYLISEPIKY